MEERERERGVRTVHARKWGERKEDKWGVKIEAGEANEKRGTGEIRGECGGGKGTDDYPKLELRKKRFLFPMRFQKKWIRKRRKKELRINEKWN